MSHPTHPACSGREETVHRYLDGDLSPAERTAFADHLQTCPACRELLDQIQVVFDALAAWQTAAPPSGIPNQVMARLPASRRKRVDLWSPILAGQLLVGLTVLVLVWSRLQARWLSLAQQLELLPALPNLLIFPHLTVPTLPLPESWPALPILPRPEFLLTPETALLLVVIILLAWLAGNVLLLGARPLPFRNGG